MSLPVHLSIRMDVATNMANATKHAFIVAGPCLILPDTTYYVEDNLSGKQLLALCAYIAAKVLAYTPLTVDEQKRYLEDTLFYKALIAKNVKSQLEWSEYLMSYRRPRNFLEWYEAFGVTETAKCTSPLKSGSASGKIFILLKQTSKPVQHLILLFLSCLSNITALLRYIYQHYCFVLRKKQSLFYLWIVIHSSIFFRRSPAITRPTPRRARIS